MNQIFPDQLVNHICCDILNRLLGSLNCFSAPISDLNELSNGVALVELIECYEDVTLIKSSDRKRDAIHRSQTNSNIDFIEKWLKVEGINMDIKRSIREIFCEIERSNQELFEFMQSHGELQVKNIVNQHRLMIYSRSIAYISALCYAIITIFLKQDKQFKNAIPTYNFHVTDDEMLHIMFYTKWKLTEEELLLKDLELMKLKDANELLEIEIKNLKELNKKNDNKFNVILSNNNNSEEVCLEDTEIRQRKNSISIESVGTISLSSFNDVPTETVSTMTKIYGDLGKPIYIDHNYSNETNDDQREEKLLNKNANNSSSTTSPVDDNHINFNKNRVQVENSLMGKPCYQWNSDKDSNGGRHSAEQLEGNKSSKQSNDEQKQNQILIARLLAELSYEKNKSSKIRQTNQEYI